jgi:hypothetical protein
VPAAPSATYRRAQPHSLSSRSQTVRETVRDSFARLRIDEDAIERRVFGRIAREDALLQTTTEPTHEKDSSLVSFHEWICHQTGRLDPVGALCQEACVHPVLELRRLSPELRDLAEPSRCPACGEVTGFDLTSLPKSWAGRSATRRGSDEPKSRVLGVPEEARGDDQREGTRRWNRPERRGESVARRRGALWTRQKRVTRYHSRERLDGLDPHDAAGRWLREHDLSGRT